MTATGDAQAARWMVRLSGAQWDLEEFAEIFQLSTVRVVQKDLEFYMEWPGLQAIAAVDDLWRVAKEAVAVLNGAVALRETVDRPVVIDAIAAVDPSGNALWHKHLEGHVRGHSRVRVRGSGGVRVPTASEIAADLAATDRKVRVLLALIEGQVTWGRLYAALDVMEEDIGGETALRSRNWVAGTELRRFAQTANSYEALGADARHALDRYKAPSDPMSLEEALGLLRAVATEWLKAKVLTAAATPTPLPR